VGVEAESRWGQEVEAGVGSCGSACQIGEAGVAAGPGTNPYYVNGKVYLTGPYKGAPFGLSIVNPAKAGPFDLGNVVVRAAIYIDPHTAQVTVISDPFPTIVKGVPTDIRSIYAVVDRPNFILNPTSCAPMSVSGTVTGVEGATVGLQSRFQVGGCGELPFKPGLSASTSGKASKANGASLHVKLVPPHEGPSQSASVRPEANIAKVKVELPKQLPAQLKTLQRACTAHVFNENPAQCPKESIVGMAVAKTPVLSNPLTGPAYFVSHGNEAFPQLVVVLQGENGLVVELVGDTFINKKTGITSSTFAHVPDVPVSSFELTLPQGKYSALGANLPAKAKGSFCNQKMVMPTTFTAQNGAEIHQNTKIAVTGCKKAKTAAQLRAAKLAAALKACHKKHGSKRSGCEKLAHKRYGPLKKKPSRKK
jgi:hypothetical protein